MKRDLLMCRLDGGHSVYVFTSYYHHLKKAFIHLKDPFSSLSFSFFVRVLWLLRKVFIRWNAILLRYCAASDGDLVLKNQVREPSDHTTINFFNHVDYTHSLVNRGLGKYVR